MVKKKDYNIKNGYMSIHEILAVNGVKQRKLINEINKEDEIASRESYDMIESDIKSTKIKTDLAKERFINELKTGLGNKIKENPNQIKIIKPSPIKKFITWFKNIFTKF